MKKNGKSEKNKKMSYDIYLKDRMSGKEIQLPIKHLMIGGTYLADYDPETDQFSPAATTEAWLNITWNYAHYYYEATENDPRFAHDEISAYYADGTTGSVITEYGIRGIYGKSGAESIPMLKDMITRIEAKYKDKDGNWISTDRDKIRYWNKTKTRQLNFVNDILGKLKPDEYVEEHYTVTIYEGINEDYWEATAANAIKPLWQLIAFAELRPDGIWDGD